MGENKETVTIPKSVYEELVRNSGLLSCLEACGVDNWGGWDDAMQLFKGEEQWA